MTEYKNIGEQTVYNMLVELIGKENCRFYQTDSNTKSVTYCLNNWHQKNKGEYFIYREAGAGNAYLTELGNLRHFELLVITSQGQPIYIDVKNWNSGSKSFLSNIAKDVISAKNINAKVFFAFIGDVVYSEHYQVLFNNLKIPKNVKVTDSLKGLKKKLKKVL